MPPLNLAVVTYKDELGLLALQAESVARFLSHETLRSFVIIVNGDYEHCLDFIDRQVMPLFEQLADRVQIVRMSDLCPYEGRSYLAQQVAKITVSRLFEGQEFYTLLDSKNFFIRPPAADEFFVNGQPTALFENLAGGTQTKTNAYYSDLLGVPPLEVGDEVMRIMTPFTMYVEVAKWLINRIEHISGKEFSEAFCTYEVFSEFMLYSTFLRFWTNEPASSHYVKSTTLTRTIWTLEAFPEFTLETLLVHFQSRGFLSLGMHRNVVRKMTADERAVFEEFLLSISLGKSLPQIAQTFWENSSTPLVQASPG